MSVPNGIAAAPEIVPLVLTSKPFGQPEAALVVNCAAAGVLEPDAQLVVTLQSYNVEAAKPVMFADVPVCAVEKLVHVPDEFNL